MSSATITTSARLMNSTPQTEEQAMVRKVAVSSFLGNFIEWFDYASYSYFATTIALVFFPTDNHTVAMLQTFGVFALSFILRPIGALFWGSYGDKKGRKAALAHSIMFMSGASFLIGCLPSYSVIGVGAPILLLLLRMVQGFSASGEYAGAATFLGEYAPTSKRGIYCSLIPASTAIGLLAGSTLATLMTANMNSSAMVGWGWRVPFLLAGPLGLIVLYIRAKLADSPVYQSMNDALESKGAASADGQIAAKSGMFAPFHCRITGQDGSVKNSGRHGLDLEQIAHMDWLCDAVDGHIPEYDELAEVSKPMYRMQGIHRDLLPVEKEAEL